MQHYDAIIIGAGACGLMCAVQAAFLGKKVLILEKNPNVGAKILISGGGRCNYTNLDVSARNFISENEHFCKSAFAQWTVDDTIRFFESYGITGKEKKLGQLFPITNNARDIVRVFTTICHDFGQEIWCNCEVKSIQKTAEEFTIQYQRNGIINKIKAKKVVVASGGLPIPKMGATDFALKVAIHFGIKLTETAPALVPLVIGNQNVEWYKELSGASIFSRVSNHCISFEENILFTHWGLSGPAILQISSYWKPGEVIEINMMPHADIDLLIDHERKVNEKKQLGNFLSMYLPRRVIESSAHYFSIEKTLGSLTREDINKVKNFINHFEVKPIGDKGYDKAEVMRGGVDTNELSSKTLESKKVSGLFFGGECVDVTGWLGGYNFQWAWASGYVIAQNL